MNSLIMHGRLGFGVWALMSLVIGSVQLGLNEPAWGLTTVIDFDPPTFSSGQAIANLSGVTFPDAPVVFTPTIVATHSPPGALHSAVPCNDTQCSNNSNQLRMTFPKGVSYVSLRAGSDESTVQDCFPEGTICPFVARLIGYDANGTAIAASKDVIVASWTGSPSGYGAINTELSIADNSARIRSAVLYIGHHLLGGSDIPGRAQIDHLTFTVPDEPVAPPVTVTPPTITLTSPTGDQCFDSSFDIVVAGRVTMSGMLDLCTSVNGSELCGQGIYVKPDGTFNGLHLDRSNLHPGQNTIRVTLYDLAGHSAVAEIQLTMAGEENDLRITGMEITQGIQEEAIPPNTGVPAAYKGVKLIRDGKTIVRVYANRSGGRCGPEGGFSLLLSGSYFDRSGVERPLGIDLPDNGSRSLVRGGAEVTFAERVDPDGAFVFTLRPDWTSNESINLRASISQASRYPPIVECSTCLANNTMVVENVRFEYRAPVVISPVEITWTDGGGTTIRPPAPPAVFARTASISPVAESGLDVRPWAGTIDVTDLVNMGLDTRTLATRVFDRVAAFEIRDLPGYTIGVAQGLDIGLEAPVAYAWPPRFEAIALVTNGARPLTNVAHEFYHSLGYYHAGLSCGGCNAFPRIVWPPDDRGRIQGIGLDRRTNSGGSNKYRIIAPGAPGQPSEWVDLMSYCADLDNNAWISVRNWEAFGSAFPNGVVPDDLILGCSEATVTMNAAAAITSMSVAPGSQSLRVLAVIGLHQTVDALRVEQDESGMVVRSDVDSSYHIIVRDKAGKVLTDTAVLPLSIHIHGQPPSTVLSTYIPGADVAGIEIRYKDRILVSRLKTASRPKVSIQGIQPKLRVSREDGILLQWDATDADGDRLEARVEYSADDGRTFHVVASGVAGRQVSLPQRLLSHSKQARVRVTVNDGFNDGVAVSDRFETEGVPPQVYISDPAQATRINEGANLHLVGMGYDDRGEPIKKDEVLQWYDGDRLLGRGARLSVSDMKPGIHVLQFQAEDDLGRRTSASVKVEVLPQKLMSKYPAEQLSELMNRIGGINVSPPLIQKIQVTLEAIKRREVLPACMRLRDMLDEVKRFGKGETNIEPEQLRQIANVASQISTIMGCPHQ
jgi:hypothetical protein